MWKYYNMDMQSYTYDVKLSHSLYPQSAYSSVLVSWAELCCTVLCSVWICSCVPYRIVSVHLTIRCRCHHFRYSYCVSFVLFLPFSSSASNSHTHTQLSTENGQMIQSIHLSYAFAFQFFCAVRYFQMILYLIWFLFPFNHVLLLA